MRLVPMFPIKSSDEMIEEYEERCKYWRAVEPCTRRIHLAVLAIAFYIGFSYLCAGLVIYGSDEYGTGADPNMSPRQAQDSGETIDYQP